MWERCCSPSCPTSTPRYRGKEKGGSSSSSPGSAWWWAWSLALLAAFAASLAGQVYYEVALEPPPRGGFEAGSVAYGAFYTFVICAPFVVVGALVVGAALALPSALRGA